MLKKLLFILFILISYSLFFPRKSFASCDFKTAKYLEHLDKPNFIKEIDINVFNSRKYVINFILKLIYSNGFKIKGTNGAVNANGGRFVFMAWAEQPEVTPFGSQSNGR